jgi:hypothetical protein
MKTVSRSERRVLQSQNNRKKQKQAIDCFVAGFGKLFNFVTLAPLAAIFSEVLTRFAF